MCYERDETAKGLWHPGYLGTYPKLKYLAIFWRHHIEFYRIHKIDAHSHIFMRSLMALDVQQNPVNSNMVQNVRRNFGSPNGIAELIMTRIKHAIALQGSKFK